MEQTIYIPSTRGVAINTKTPLEVWHCLVDKNIVQIITNHTNQEIKCTASDHKEKKTSEVKPILVSATKMKSLLFLVSSILLVYRGLPS